MQSELWRVGEYQVSGAANTICLEGADPVKLPPRLIDTLLYFARHAGEVISRKELVENVWNRSVVTDQTVTQNIFELRKFLRGGRDRLHAQEYILTIPKRGYQLVVDVQMISSLEGSTSAAENNAIEDATSETPEETAKIAEKIAPPDSQQAPSESKAPSDADKPEDNSESPKKRGFKEFVKSFWLDENSAGFKRAAY